MVREVKLGEDAWSVKCEYTLFCCSQPVIVNVFKLNCKSNHQTSIQIKIGAAALVNYMCSVVWSPHIFIYNSPSSTYHIILFLEAYTHPPHYVCIVPPDLDCCSLHICILLCELLPSYHSMVRNLSKHVLS